MRHESHALVVMAELCLDFAVYDINLWQNLLRQMTAHKLTSELGRILVAAAGVPELWCLPDLEQAWAKVVDASAQRACTGGARAGSVAEAAVLLALQSPFALRGNTQQLQEAAEASGRDVLCMMVMLANVDGVEKCVDYVRKMDVDRLFSVLDEVNASGMPLASKVGLGKGSRRQEAGG